MIPLLGHLLDAAVDLARTSVLTVLRNELGIVVTARPEYLVFTTDQESARGGYCTCSSPEGGASARLPLLRISGDLAAPARASARVPNQKP